MSGQGKQASTWTSIHGKYGNPHLCSGAKGNQKLIGQVYFPFDSSSLDEADKNSLNFLSSRLSSLTLKKSFKLRFCGHCDSRGSDSYNKALAMRRAKAVSDFVFKGVASDRRLRLYSSVAVSHGEEFAGNGNMDLDRRVDIFSSYIPKSTDPQPPISIEGKPTVKRVLRPVQYLQIDMFPPQGKALTTIIVEKYRRIDAELDTPSHPKLVKHWQHYDEPQGFTFPGVYVHRNTVDWRKHRSSDTVEKVVAAILNYLKAISNVPGEDIDISGKPGFRGAYKSWDDYKKRGGTYFLKYRNM